MYIPCLKREPREWQYCLYTWTLWLPSACIPVYCTAAFVMCQVAELMPQPSAKTLKAAVLWGSVWAGEPDWPEIKRAAGAVQTRERLQVSTVLEKPHPLTTILQRWGLASLLGLLWASETSPGWQGQSDRLRQDTASDEYTLFLIRDTVIHASLGIFSG